MAMIDTIYGPQSANTLKLFSRVKLLACDVDGIFSDGRIYMGQQGEELKAFHTRDGYGVKALQSIGVHLAVITGRRSNIVEQRMTSLGVHHIIQGCEDKQTALAELQKQLGISIKSTASMGDDIPDLGMFEVSDMCFSVTDGHPSVKQKAHYITQNRGGFGAVREICDLILLAKGKLSGNYGASI
ncbi:3-deoxy-manno-octulosonate-8-phosphatase KdsC [Flavobacterium sp. W21_SRS_FM6]|uniref:3-deoxy-manno-octulosonate-8-phosphatase KdsC n=1 Tax=Flavobacterium sp. W21_SRS_FM6 TaxID=3240268 RepID=UPI003F93B78E